MEDKGLIAQGVQGGFASIASAFVIESLNHMIPWLMVMFAVIITDLVFGLRKSKLMKIKIRWSKAVRITMGKMVTYFAFVCMVCMLNTAMGNGYLIDKWACCAVCAVEGISIAGNYLKPKGIELSSIGALKLLFHKITRLDESDINKVIKKSRKRKDTKDEKDK